MSHKHALGQKVRIYTPDLARAIYDVLMELGAIESDFVLFAKYLCWRDNRSPWHFARFRFKSTECVVEMYKGQPPRNFEAVNKKLAEIRRGVPLVDLVESGA